MAGKFYPMQQGGVGVATGSPANANYSYQSPGDQGHGWQYTYTGTNTALISGGVSDVIIPPDNARNASITYWYNGAGTVTLNVQGTNDSLANIYAGTAIFGTIATVTAPQIVGGTAGSTAVTITMEGVPAGIRLIVAGSGSTGADTLGLTITCNTIIRP
jgi:hypothetical protein